MAERGTLLSFPIVVVVVFFQVSSMESDAATRVNMVEWIDRESPAIPPPAPDLWPRDT